MKPLTKEVLTFLKIDSINISGFGKLSDFSVSFSDTLNVVFGLNESGKSTMQEFIKAMFYGLAGGKTSRDGIPPPSKLKSPWNEGRFGGSMEYTADSGEKYRIVRDFAKNTVKLYDGSFNEISSEFKYGPDKLPAFAEVHTGMNEKCFESTVFIRQMSLNPGRDRLQDLQDKLLNVSLAGDEAISYLAARKALNDALISGVGTGRTYTRPLDTVMRRLKELNNLRTSLYACKDEAALLLEKLGVSRSKIKDLSAEEDNLKKQLQEAKDKITAHERSSPVSVKHGSIRGFRILKLLKDIALAVLMISGATTAAFSGLMLTEKLPVRILASLKTGLWPLAAVAAFSFLAFLLLSYLDSRRKMLSIQNALLEKGRESAKLAEIAEGLSASLHETEVRLNSEFLLVREYETKLERYDTDDDKLQMVEEEISHLETRVLSLEETGKALQTAIEVLDQCSSRIKAGIMPRLNEAMSGIIPRLTGGKYSDLRAGDTLTPSLADSASQNIVIPAFLSSGTADQVYLAMRLAMAWIYGGNKLSLPLFLDEVFSQFDDIRLKSALEYITSLTGQTQIILFTCRRCELNQLMDIAGDRINLIEL